MSSSPSLHRSGNLREETEAKHNLEKENFDLKMRVYYLEEGVRKTNTLGGGNTSGPSVHGHAQMDGNSNSFGDTLPMHSDSVSSLHLQLEEKNLELEQRDMLLTKAKTALEALKKEILKMKTDHDPKQVADAEERIRKLKEANEQIEHTSKAQLQDMEGQLVEARQNLHFRDNSISDLTTQNEKLTLQVETLEERCKEAREECDNAQQHTFLVNQKCERMEEELTQARAHVELYRMETDEAQKEAEHLKHSLRDAEDVSHHQQELRDLRHQLEEKAMNEVERVRAI
jgi:centrosomin